MIKSIFLLIFLFLIIFILNSCGGEGGVIPPPAGTTATPTATPLQNGAEKFSQKADDISGSAETAGLTILNYASLSTSSLETSSTIVIPPLPSAVPVIPSANPAYTRFTSYPLGTDWTIGINWYVYLLPSSWLEWSGTQVYTGQVPVANFYGQVFQPTPIPGTSQETREFKISRWIQNKSFLRLYTAGTGTYDTSDPNEIEFKGTQVLFLLRSVDGKQQIAYDFDFTRKPDGSLDGAVTFENADGDFKRDPLNPGAIGTTGTYAHTYGSLNITSPSAVTVTFDHIMQGDGVMILTKTNTTNNITTTMTFNPDNSGTGKVEGVPNTTISLSWDNTGIGTATIKIGQLPQKQVPVYVPRPYTPLLPSP